jgi:dipeptide transport system permease protein
MIRFILGKLLYLVPTFLGITFVAFAFVREQLGFSQPVWQQYLHFLGRLLQGDLGNSLVTKKPVLTEFLSLFPATVELGLVAIIIATLIGVPVGVIAAIRRGSWFDQISMTTALVGFSMPIFWWGLLLIIMFSGILQWTPVSGRISLMYFFPPVTGFMLIDSLISGQKGAFSSALSHLILPSIVLATIPLAVIARQTRSAMLEVMGEDYVRTAKAKGLSARRVIGVHALRNAMIPVITTIGLQIGVLMAGAILTETIFSWPGIGKWMIDSISRRDYPVVQSGLLLIAGIVMIVNLIVDLTYGLINPRIRHK